MKPAPLLIGLFTVLSGAAVAEYDGPTTSEMRAWFRTIRNADNQVCCDDTEVAHVSEYQWRSDHFEVVVDSVQYRVAPKAVSTQSNRLGEALVWFWPKGAPRSEETLRCFLRGTEG